MTNKKVPDFVIVGAAKSGTSSLSYYLGEHPEIFLPKQQIHFHSHKQDTEEGWERYADYFSGAMSGQIIGEHSPFYYTHEEAASSLSANCPGVKLIWLLRNPIDRAWSHYWYTVMKGNERVTPQNILNHERWQDIYIRKSEYSSFMETYLRYFDRQNMMFIFTEELRESPDSVLSGICDFLDVDDSFSFNNRTGEIKRRTNRPRYIVLHQWVHRLRRGRFVSRFGVSRMLDGVFNWNLSSSLPYPAIPQAEKKRLEEYFEPFNLRLSKLIDRDVKDIWRDAS